MKLKSNDSVKTNETCIIYTRDTRVPILDHAQRTTFNLPSARIYTRISLFFVFCFFRQTAYRISICYGGKNPNAPSGFYDVDFKELFDSSSRLHVENRTEKFGVIVGGVAPKNLPIVSR